MLRLHARSATIVVAAIMLPGCDRQDPIRAYRTPKDSGAAAALAVPVRSTNAQTSEDERLTWSLPEGWIEQPGDGAMRFATLIDEHSTPKLEVTVTKLSSQAGSLLANVNRWRGQLGLAEMHEHDLASMTRQVRGANLDGTVVDLTGSAESDAAPQRMIAAVFETQAATWFFKAVNAKSVIDAAESELIALFQSVSVHSSPNTSVAESADQVRAPAIANAKPLSFTVPDGWREDSSPRPARIMTLLIDAHPSTELAITRFPGDVGGELANVNRWRGQLGLPAVPMLEGQNSQDITIGGKAGRLYHLTSSDEAGLAMLVAFAQHEGNTWFFKLTGPAASIAAERARFQQFIDSVRFNSSS